MLAIVDVPLSPPELRQRWIALLNDPEAPDQFELDELGEILVSPAPSNRHQIIVLALLKQVEA